MIFNNLKNSFVSAVAFLVLAGTAVPVLAAPIKNIVLVHDAFVDGSGWKPVYDILVKDGYSVRPSSIRQWPKPQNSPPKPQSRIFLTVDIPLFSPSSEGFCHGAHLDFNDPRTRGLFAGQQNRAGHVFGLQHVRVVDPFLSPSPAKRKFSLHASGTDHADLDAVRS